MLTSHQTAAFRSRHIAIAEGSSHTGDKRAPSAKFMSVHLINRYLIGVYLTRVHLIGVYLMGVYLIGVYLMGVYLTGVYLMDGHFTSVHLTGVVS